MSKRLRLNAPPRRILLIRLSAFGDVVMASGLIRSLRTLWPEAHLAWLAEESLCPLLSAHPELNALHALPYRRWKTQLKKGHWWRTFLEIKAFRRQLQRESFDLAIDLQGLMKSGLWAYWSGAPNRLGLGSREGSQWLMSHTLPRDQKDPRMGKEYRHLARVLGAPDEAFKPDLPAPESEIQRTLRAEAHHHGKALALFAPFTTRPQKHWFNDRWVHLAKALSPHYHCLILGGPAEQAQADALVVAAEGSLASLCGKTTLPECADLIKAARLLIGVDTGLTHLAMAQGTPTLALFGSTCPYWEPLHDRALILYKAEPCSPCHRHPSCGGRFPCMAAHRVEDLLDAVAILTRPRTESPGAS